MESFKLWMLSLCGATAITSLFRILLSSTSLNKVLNIFFTLFVLFYTITPIQSFFDNKDFNNILTDTPTQYNEVYKNGYEQIIELSIKNECKKLDVEVLSCNIVSYLNSDGYLCVESIEVQIDNNEMNEKINSVLKEQLGYEVVVK